MEAIDERVAVSTGGGNFSEAGNGSTCATSTDDSSAEVPQGITSSSKGEAKGASFGLARHASDKEAESTVAPEATVC